MAEESNHNDQEITERLTWLVASRNRIQSLLIIIYKLITENRDEIGKDEIEGPIVGRLVGAAFSLWRSVFLADVTRKWPTVLRASEKFLEEIIRNNAITYAQDFRLSEYSFGYYLNNARHRIRELRNQFPEYRNALADNGLGELPDMSITGKNGRSLWDSTYLALEIAVVHCTKLYDKPSHAESLENLQAEIGQYVHFQTIPAQRPANIFNIALIITMLFIGIAIGAFAYMSIYTK